MTFLPAIFLFLHTLVNTYFLFQELSKKDFIYLFLERGREGEREGEKPQCVVASHIPPTGDLACSPGMCPHWETNLRPFGSQSSAQSTEPHQPGPFLRNYYSHPSGCLIVVLICILLMTNDVDMLIGHLYIFSGKMSIQILCAILNWMVGLLLSSK